MVKTIQVEEEPLAFNGCLTLLKMVEPIKLLPVGTGTFVPPILINT
jgi:hypothetical protein